MKFGSLFAGIGGIDLGLERAGMECVWQVENDPYAIKILEKHWSNVHREKDVKEVGKHNLEPVDLICGGFPCQPHSFAGKRRGKKDDRNLWGEYLRIVKEIRPRYVLAENVPGIITTMLDEVLSDLESEGYTCWTFNIPACAFDAPHRRERIFVVAYTPQKYNGLDSPEPMQGQTQKSGIGAIKGIVPDTSTKGLEKHISESELSERQSGLPAEYGWWSVEPDVGRVAHGVHKRVDRLKCLGNAVVPQVAEWIGRRIMEYENSR